MFYNMMEVIKVLFKVTALTVGVTFFLFSVVHVAIDGGVNISLYHNTQGK